MTSNALAYADELDQPDSRPYRVVSKAAVASLLVAVVSLLALLFPPLLILPLSGLLAGLFGWRNIRRYPDEVSGKVVAVLGSGLCGAILIGGLTLHWLAYATEVPDGYQRISFANLQPVPQHPEWPVPPEALMLNGQRIFVKGYLYPDGQQDNIKRFVLVPDMGTCCFGGQPKLTDMIEVTLKDPLRAEFARRKRRLGGILTVDTALKPVSGLGGVYYQLAADYYR